jgi:hypothetical protein
MAPRGVALAVATCVAVAVSGCGGSPAAAPAPARVATSAPASALAPGPTRTGGVRAATVDPDELTRTDDPRLSWYDVRTRTLHHGRRATPLTVEGTVESLATAGPSDLLVVSSARDLVTLLRVDPDGSTVVLVTSRNGGLSVTVSSDARTFTWLSGIRREALVVVARVADGHEVARHPFAPGQIRVLSLTPDRALVSTFRGTVWWRFGDDTLTPVAVPPWPLPRGEVVGAFNPDGALVLTGRNRDVDFRGYDVVQDPLRVRDAATGRVQATFDGRFGWYDTGGARWEDDDHFLAVARDPAYRSGDPTVRRSWVRCSVTTGSCEAAGPVEVARLDVPPYGPLERLVSGPLDR